METISLNSPALRLWALVGLLLGGAWTAPDCVAAGTAVQGGDTTPAARAPLPPPEFLPGCLKLIRAKRYEQARELLQPVVRDHPTWPRARFYLGLTYHRQDRYEQAAAEFARALEADPEYHSIRVFYGWALYYMGDLDTSREMFESYLKIKPDYPDALFALGLIAFDEDDIAEAGKHFTRTIELARTARDPRTESKARARLADVWIRTDDLDKAKQELQQSVKLNADNYEVYFKLSRVLQRLGDEEGAEQARQRHETVRERVRPSRPAGEPREPNQEKP